MDWTTLLKRMGLEQGALRLAYMLGREQGRTFVRGALIFPGIRLSDLERLAEARGDDSHGLVTKRDAMVEAMLDFLEEYADLAKA